MEPGKTIQSVSEDLVLMQFYLGKGNLEKTLEKCSALRLQLSKLKLMQITESDFQDWDRIDIPEVQKILQHLTEEIQERLEKGETGEQVGKELLEEFGGLDLEDGSDMVSWAATAERLGEERDWLEEELERSEGDFLKEYEKRQSDKS